MKIKLINEKLLIEIDSKGAELTSIKSVKDNCEYLWQGDSNSWTRSAPILFPIVGAISDDEYKHKDSYYTMTQHGFARDMTFEILEQNTNSVLLSIQDNADTLSIFPFQFELIIGYELIDNRIKVSYEVINQTDGSILFQIGAHPGFNCPIEQNLQFQDYKLVLEKNEVSDRRYKNNKLLNGIREKFLKNSNVIKLKHELFKDGAIIFDDLKSTNITLESDKGNKKVKMDFEGFPYFGIWSWPPTPSDFVCLEPWYGIDSTEGDDPDLGKKEGMIFLDFDEVFEAFYTIEII